MTLGPPTVRPVSGFNRSLEHVAAFALLGLAFALAYPRRRVLPQSLIGAAVVALMEILQQIVPGRHAYFRDFIINAGGACAGIVLAILFDWFRRRNRRGRRDQTEQRIARDGGVGRGSNICYSASISDGKRATWL